jgi:hypothetical protein
MPLDVGLVLNHDFSSRGSTTHHEIPVVERSVHLLDIQVGVPGGTGSDSCGYKVGNGIRLAGSKVREGGTEGSDEIRQTLALSGARWVFVVDVTALENADQN